MSWPMSWPLAEVMEHILSHLLHAHSFTEPQVPSLLDTCIHREPLRCLLFASGVLFRMPLCSPLQVCHDSGLNMPAQVDVWFSPASASTFPPAIRQVSLRTWRAFPTRTLQDQAVTESSRRGRGCENSADRTDRLASGAPVGQFCKVNRHSLSLSLSPRASSPPLVDLAGRPRGADGAESEQVEHCMGLENWGWTEQPKVGLS